MVEFGPRSTGGFNESDFQPTFLFDIIHYTDALMHKIQIGDFVLAPDGQQGRFVPGEVLDGFERRASCESKYIDSRKRWKEQCRYEICICRR